MRELRFTLLGDGPSYACLLRHLRWLVEQYISEKLIVQGDWADLSFFPDKPRGLAQRIEAALEYYPCDLLFIHRDAEREPAERRYEEIGSAKPSAR
jgi:hypothetical protein